MSRKRVSITDLLNDLTFNTTFKKFKLIAVNAFEWEGLPDGILERHIERVLFDHGKAIFFRDPQMSFMCLETQNGTQLNVYGDPLHYRAYGYNYNKEYKADDCVIIENNKLRLNTYDFVMHYVKKIVEAERTMDVNIKAVKTPVIFACDDNTALTLKAISAKVDDNVPYLYIDKSISLNDISTLDTGAKFLCNDLMDYKKSVENELLTFLGLNNTPVDKKERLITDEAEANDELIASFADLQLEARERACEAINQMYGLNVSVRRKVVDNSDKIEDNSEGGDRDEL